MSNHIKKFTQKQKDAAKLGAEGGLGLIAGTIGRLGRTFGNAAKQYLRDTDWYAIRKAETGKDIPTDIKTKRAQARLDASEE